MQEENNLPSYVKSTAIFALGYIISVLASVSKYLFIISSNKVIDIVTNGISQEIGRLTIGDLPWLQKA